MGGAHRARRAGGAVPPAPGFLQLTGLKTITPLYQPQVDSATGEVLCIESLLRWRQEKPGWLLPPELIRAAEEAGLIGKIGMWVLEQSCRQAAGWRQRGLNQFRVAVNISALQIDDPNFAHDVQRILEESGLEPKFLELELTEGRWPHNLTVAAANLQVLRESGVTIAIDDFGTGYASFVYLRLFPVDKVKIDKSFIQDIGRLEYQDRSIALIEAILSLTSELRLSVVAEGVETEQQKQTLDRLGCHQVQGFLYSKPMPGHKIEAWMKARIPAAIER